jgi:hypothetical protein
MLDFVRAVVFALLVVIASTGCCRLLDTGCSATTVVEEGSSASQQKFFSLPAYPARQLHSDLCLLMISMMVCSSSMET